MSRVTKWEGSMEVKVFNLWAIYPIHMQTRTMEGHHWKSGWLAYHGNTPWIKMKKFISLMAKLTTMEANVAIPQSM